MRWRAQIGPNRKLGLEESFVQNLTKSPSLWAFFQRPVAAGLGAACIALWVLPIAVKLLRRGAESP